MMMVPTGVRVHIAVGMTDMRKGRERADMRGSLEQIRLVARGFPNPFQVGGIDMDMAGGT